jgi:hypothetical protein
MNPDPTGLEKLITLGLPWLNAEEANQEIARLHVRIMELEAKMNREKLIRLYDEVKL